MGRRRRRCASRILEFEFLSGKMVGKHSMNKSASAAEVGKHSMNKSASAAVSHVLMD